MLPAPFFLVIFVLLAALLYIVKTHLAEVRRRRGDFRMANMGYPGYQSIDKTPDLPQDGVYEMVSR